MNITDFSFAALFGDGQKVNKWFKVRLPEKFTTRVDYKGEYIELAFTPKPVATMIIPIFPDIRRKVDKVRLYKTRYTVFLEGGKKVTRNYE